MMCPVSVGLFRFCRYASFLQDTFEMQEGSISKGQNVLIVDDLLATGGK